MLFKLPAPDRRIIGDGDKPTEAQLVTDSSQQPAPA